MKASWWKYVLLALLTAGVVACGKDNKTAVPTNITSGNPLTNGTTTAVTSTDFGTFKNQVAAGQFVVQQYSAVTYYFYDVVFSSQNNNCDKWWIFTYCSSSNQSGGSFMRRYDKVNNFVEHEYGNSIQAIHAQLVGIVNSASATYGSSGYRQVSPTAWEIRNSAGAFYVIDVSKPVIANPVYYRPANVSTEDGYSYNGAVINVL